ncbi:DUF1653 domain-containing protein [Lachnospira pectinoschiza]|uniref:DUF1653 domain-containing protein n=1 Tax=Lachnospira pectinoschiza TaxID=28052 RepID=A0A1G9YEA0_9FIRM|nr:DUF1653 domain-containing protein [Lachnospira pectinoschiza]SDN06956.1 Protein of unknown function [Lachnospira pectinoschiza]
MSRKLVIGGFYKHFKNKLYKVDNIVYHSETKEALVLYQALYGDFKQYVRPLDMFMSEVDHVKYPEVKQKYRFSQVSLDEFGNVSPIDEAEATFSKAEEGSAAASQAEAVKPVAEATSPETDSSSKEDRIASLVEKFLDSKEYEDKLDALLLLNNNINDDLIDLFAESLDIVVEKGSLADRVRSLKAVLQAHTKYEGGRLRR